MTLAVLGAALFGLVMGSFSTVLVDRLHTGESFIGGRSRCPFCGTTLRWFELLPVLSFLAQGGRCRSCARAIPRSYLAIEMTSGASFALLAFAIATGSLIPPASFAALLAGSLVEALGTFFFYAVFLGVAIVVSFYDFTYRLIPRGPIILLIVLGLADKLAAAIMRGSVAPLGGPLAVGISAFLLFWSLWFFSGGRAMGRGDADVALAIGLTLPSVAAIAGYLFAFWLGSAWGILEVVRHRLTLKSQIAFAPFLFLGPAIALFVSAYLEAQYLMW